MRRLGVLLAAAAVAGCQSSAPYTLPAAALNSALAVGAALEQKAAGGCYATCSHGTVCNPRTGYCESPSAAEVCDQANRSRALPVMGVSRRREGAPPAGLLGTGIGVSPATGSVPPPPAEASPKPPGTP
jgi:hypothetical protein